MEKYSQEGFFHKLPYVEPGSTKRIHLLIQEMQERLFDPWVRKIPGKRKWQPTPVFLPEKSHGQRNLVGYSPWGHKESDPTEA